MHVRDAEEDDEDDGPGLGGVVLERVVNSWVYIDIDIDIVVGQSINVSASLLVCIKNLRNFLNSRGIVASE